MLMRTHRDCFGNPTDRPARKRRRLPRIRRRKTNTYDWRHVGWIDHDYASSLLAARHLPATPRTEASSGYRSILTDQPSTTMNHKPG